MIVCLDTKTVVQALPHQASLRWGRAVSLVDEVPEDFLGPTSGLTPSTCKEGLPVTNLEAGCENKCASPYIGEWFGENSVGGKCLMGAVLRIALTLTGRGKGAVGG